MNEKSVQEEPFVFRALNEGDLSDFLFSDRLSAFTKSDVSAGEFQVSFKIVHLASQIAVRAEMQADGVLAGVPTGTRVSALLDLSLLTLHEECSEYLELPGKRLLERRWTLQRDETNGSMRWARHNRCRLLSASSSASAASGSSSEPWHSDGCVEVAAAEAVIGEAAAFLLQRILFLRPALLGISEAEAKPLRCGRRWRVVTVDRDGSLRPCSFTWLGDAAVADAAAAGAVAGVMRTLGGSGNGSEREISSWFDADGHLVVRRIENWPVEMRASQKSREEDAEERRRAGEAIADRRPSVTPSGCFCGFISTGTRQRSVRSERQ